MKIGYIILHYNTIEDTQNCVESIIKNSCKSNYRIIIVDNASKNDSGKKLKEIYCDNKNIIVILNKKNLGFANGNNVGFNYAKYKLNCDFIILLNNDTLLLQNNLEEIIQKEYSENNFAVMGPKIKLKNNKIQPVESKLFSKKEMKNFLIKNRIILYLNYIGIYNILKKIFTKKRKKIESKLDNDVDKKYFNVILHGCFLIFSPIYINKFDGLDHRTFLYCEEHLLYLRLMKEKMISEYNPEIEIFHMEDSATDSIVKSSRSKNIFVCKNRIKSGKILYNEIKKIEK